MEIDYRENELTPAAFLSLADSIGWTGYTLRQVEKGLANTPYAVAAYDSGLVVGMGRLIGDGSMKWSVEEVIVRPSHQGKGIGRGIMERLVGHVQEV